MLLKFMTLLASVLTTPANAADNGPRTTPTHVYYCGVNHGTNAAARACFDIPPNALGQGGTLFLLFGDEAERQQFEVGQRVFGELDAPHPAIIQFAVYGEQGLAAFESTYVYSAGTYPGDGGYEPESLRALLLDGTTIQVDTLQVN